ncbi:P-type conjugative transfer protein TrbL [Pseudomonas sp. PSE14]|uniref:P-type conjugative transfer protein TrbL n=1 Tax=Pseudomonas sp. PSE14 TaxID=3016341 RepID=UPI0023D7E45C|nr:P-type conjugative transfer protein TrbL [Pseudomonas sp. PSE14]WEJ71959.1 P-type conjugative transfer protein TrbL [Pseudomonas sp. PSE14]
MRRANLPLIVTAALLAFYCASASAALPYFDPGTQRGVLDDVILRFSQKSSLWASKITGYATWLFWTLATISMVWTFGLMALRKADIGEFFAELVRFIMFTGFFWWLLIHGPEYADSIIRSLRTIGEKASNNSDISPSGIVNIGFVIFKQAIKGTSAWSPVDSLVGVVLSILVLSVLALVAVNMLLLLISGWILIYAGIFFLGFGGGRWTSDMAINYYKTVLGLAAQVLTMILLVGIGQDLLTEFYNKMTKGTLNFEELGVVLVVAIALLMLVNKVPALVGGIVSGGGMAAGAGIGSFGAGALVGAASMAATAVSGGATALMSGASNLAGGAQSMYSAFKSAQSNVAAGTDIASRMAGVFGDGGGGGSGAGDGGASPLGAAMGLASAASGGVDGGAASSVMSAMSSSGGQDSGGSLEGSKGSGDSDSGAAGPMAQAADVGGGSGAGSASPLAGGGRVQDVADSGDGDRAGGRIDGGSNGGSASPRSLGSAGRIALDMGANLVSGMGRMAQSRIDRTLGGQLAAEISNPGSSSRSSNLDTSSASSHFDPAAEVAAYRDSKQENS